MSNEHITVKFGDIEGFLENFTEVWTIIKMIKDFRVGTQLCIQCGPNQNLKDINLRIIEHRNNNCWFRTHPNHTGNCKYIKAVNVE